MTWLRTISRWAAFKRRWHVCLILFLACLCWLPMMLSLRNHNSHTELFENGLWRVSTNIEKTDKEYPQWEEAIHISGRRMSSREVFENGNLTVSRHIENSSTEYPQWKEAIHIAGRTKSSRGFLTIGLPTMRRPNASYVFETLRSLVGHTTDEDKTHTTIVIFISDRNATYAEEFAQNLIMWFPKHVENGFIQVIRAPDAYYPSLRYLKKTYGDGMERVKWRSKQNLDYAFLMHYSQPLSEYYLQLEDDVIAVPDYLGQIKSYIQRMNMHETWTMLEFSRMGYIGKLYHSSDVGKLAYFLRVFFNEQPCDYLLKHFLKLMLQKSDFIYPKELFIHSGYWSSLPNQTRPELVKNTEATLSTTMTIHESFTLHNVYSGKGNMWAKDVKIGDTVTITFPKPRKLVQITVLTGSKNHKMDIAESAILEYSSDTNCQTYTYLCTFDEAGEANYVKDGIESVRCVRMRMTKSQKYWLIINTIRIL